ncbi:hypothetical protein D3C79_512150 [compost metagenome]
MAASFYVLFLFFQAVDDRFPNQCPESARVLRSDIGELNSQDFWATQFVAPIRTITARVESLIKDTFVMTGTCVVLQKD